jgi:diguanylate cyclase (GGDEF)-like protein/PAS domain S-box-containing protein
MNVSRARDTHKEISALIARLHDTGQRLELLTAGEVDSVSDAQGRTFLLQSAQERMRQIEATRQAAVLNALPAHIALLDAQGVIVTVNEAWRDFGDANAVQGPGYGVGADYLAICDRAHGVDSAEARRAAAGIRTVLAGAAKRFALEYPCHSPTGKRWFLMSVTPLAEEHVNGAVVMHIDVTEKRRTEEGLRISETRFRQMAENIRDVFFLRDTVGRILYVSPAYAEIWGLSCESLYADPDSWKRAIHPEDRTATVAKTKRGLRTGRFNFECRIVRPDGSIRWIESRAFPVLDAAGTMVRVAGVTIDITVRKHAELGIKRLNRVNSVLSQLNGLIVRVSNRDELFNEACRIALEVGGFPLSTIGIVDRTSMTIAPVASAGNDQKLLAAVKHLVSSRESASSTIVVRAITEKQPVVSNDSLDGSQVKLDRKYSEAGIRSMALLPLIVANEVTGVFALFSGEIEFFQEEEMKLLKEMAGNIALAMDYIDKQERINYLAYHDVLTGLANHGLFLERLAQHVQTAAAAGTSLAVILVDLERFKIFNDSLGRPAGDALLRQVAEWLTQSTGDASLLARVGADQFAVVLPELWHEGDVARLLEKSIAVFLDRSFHLQGISYRVAARAGVALFPQDGEKASTLFLNAEAALKNAKAGGDRYLFYTKKMTDAVAGKLTLENQLRRAIDREELALYYQPKMNFASGKLASAEALIRWNDPRTGLVSPNRFIPVLEETGLIHEAGRWVLRKAISDYLRWRDTGLTAVRVAVNVSALQLRSLGFIAELEQALAVDARAAAGLELEVTESLVMADIKHSIATLQAVRAMGVTVAIDDFGTGFSSLSYLAKLPVDALKIDRSFVVAMTDSSHGQALVTTIITLAHSLKLTVVAEGVETEEQSRLLRLLGCDEMQGYFFSKPLPVEDFEARFLVPGVSAVHIR